MREQRLRSFRQFKLFSTRISHKFQREFMADPSQDTPPAHRRTCPPRTIGHPASPPILGNKPTSPTPLTPSWCSLRRSAAVSILKARLWLVMPSYWMVLRARLHKSPTLALKARAAPATAWVQVAVPLTVLSSTTTTTTTTRISATHSTGPSSASHATMVPPTHCHG
jgi:hypothetical protein